jgi:phage tail-like protein
VTHDPEFETWAGRVRKAGSGSEVDLSLKATRKDMMIEVLNPSGRVTVIVKLYRCWVSEYQALPDLDAGANAVAIEILKLENEGWERDEQVA